MKAAPHYEFGEFSLDLSTIRLMRGASTLSDDDKIVKALELLCQRYPDAVDKDELLEKLWPDQVVSDWSISKLISDIRQTLGDNGKDQGYIKTVRGQGFRMNVPVIEKAQVATDPLSPKKTFQYRNLATPLVVAIVMVLTAVGLTDPPSDEASDESTLPTRIAVLPVASKTDASPNDWVKYGSMAMIAEQLSQYQGIQVIPVERVVATGLSGDSATFEAVCGQLGCAQLVSLAFDVIDDRPQLSYVLKNHKTSTEPVVFSGIDVMAATNALSDSLVQTLLPEQRDLIPIELTFSDNTKANRDYAIGVHELFDGEFNDARRYLNIALDREPSFFWAKAHLAELEYRVGNLTQASSLIDELLGQGPEGARAYFLENIRANILYSEGKLNESLTVTLILKNNPFVKADPLLYANQSLNAGSSMQALGKLDQAIPQLQEALVHYQKAGFGSGEGRVLFNLANVYLTNSDHDKAIELYRQAEDVFIRFGLTGYALLARHQLVTTGLHIGYIQNAESELERLIQAYRENGDIEGELTARNDLALAKLVKQEYQAAATQAEQALQGLQSTDFSYLKNHALHLGAKAHLMLHKPQQAEALLSQLEGEWYDPRPGYAFIHAHLALEKGEFDNALTQATELKAAMKEGWTGAHEQVLVQIQIAAETKKKTVLRY